MNVATQNKVFFIHVLYLCYNLIGIEHIYR